MGLRVKFIRKWGKGVQRWRSWYGGSHHQWRRRGPLRPSTHASSLVVFSSDASNSSFCWKLPRLVVVIEDAQSTLVAVRCWRNACGAMYSALSEFEGNVSMPLCARFTSSRKQQIKTLQSSSCSNGMWWRWQSSGLVRLQCCGGRVVSYLKLLCLLSIFSF